MLSLGLLSCELLVTEDTGEQLHFCCYSFCRFGSHRDRFTDIGIGGSRAIVVNEKKRFVLLIFVNLQLSLALFKDNLNYVIMVTFGELTPMCFSVRKTPMVTAKMETY